MKKKLHLKFKFFSNKKPLMVFFAASWQHVVIALQSEYKWELNKP